MTKRENDAIWTAAEKANRQCGQWMPQRWIEIFIKELASAPPATPAGVGADEIARVFARWKKSKNLHESLAAQSIEKELLALLSRAGDQK